MNSSDANAKNVEENISDEELLAASGGANISIQGNPNVKINVSNSGSQGIVENDVSKLNVPGS